jgi:hypothetical protein
MTKTSTALAIAGGTLVTVCVAGGGVIGLARAFDQPQVATSTVTTSHGVTTNPVDNDPFTQKTAAPDAPAPMIAPPPVVVPPAAPRILDVPVQTDTKAVTKKTHDWNGDAHRWMHEHQRGDFDNRPASSDPAPAQQNAPAQRMAPAPQQKEAPAPRHRADPRGSDWGHHDGGSHGGWSHDGGHGGGHR